RSEATCFLLLLRQLRDRLPGRREDVPLADVALALHVARLAVGRIARVPVPRVDRMARIRDLRRAVVAREDAEARLLDGALRDGLAARGLERRPVLAAVKGRIVDARGVGRRPGRV